MTFPASGDGVMFVEGATLGYCPNFLMGKTSADVFAVIQAAADPNSGQNGLWALGTSGVASAYPDAAGDIIDDFGSSTSHTIPIEPSLLDLALYQVRTTATEWTVYFNNVRVFTTATNTVSWPDELTVGGGVRIKELMVYSPALADTDRQQVSEALRSRYDLPFESSVPVIPTTQPFGITLLPEDLDVIGTAPWTGALLTLGTPAGAVAQLEAAQASGVVVIASFTPEPLIISSLGNFDFNAYRAQVESFRGTDLSAFIADGTLAGIQVLDQPRDPHWGQQGISNEVLDATCALWKDLYPTVRTYIGATPTELTGWTWNFLDGAWCMYAAQDGELGAFIATQRTLAQQLGLSVMWGLDVLNGGPTDAADPVYFGRPGTVVGSFNMGPAALTSYGTVLQQEAYSDGVFISRWEDSYMSADILAAFTALAAL